MTEVEEYFPRGGKKPATIKHFKQNVNFLGKPEKTDKRKRKPRKVPDGDDGYLSDDVDKGIRQSVKNCSTDIRFQTLKPGFLLLCRIRLVSETKVYLSLPSKLLGRVMACHISEPYNKVLEAYVNDQVDRVPDMSKMFHPGQYVVCQVLDVEQRDNILLSMMPQHVNGKKSYADLVKGTIIQAAVSSIEDHGYVMDIGIPDTRAFLPKSNANTDTELLVGMLTWCAVKSTSPESALVTLSNDVESLQKAVLKRSAVNALLPASPVLFTVDQPLENGIEGHILDNVTSYVKRCHTDTVKGKKPKLGQKVRAYVLYVMPTSNTPRLTMKDIFDPKVYNLQEEQKFRDGQIVEDAQVLNVYQRSIIFRLGPNSFGLLTPKVKAHEDKTAEQVLAKAYSVGSTHKIRVLRYNPSDHLYTLTDNPSVINVKYFSLRDLSVGETVEGQVAEVGEKVRVRIGRCEGIIPLAHMSDAGYCMDHGKSTGPQLPKKKFKVGQPIQVRVLKLDADKHQLVVTAKPSLLNPDVEVLKSYDQAQVGKAYTGVIKYIKPDYILVSFFNEVTAYVAKRFVCKDPKVSLLTAFHLGQIVNCTIIDALEDNKLFGSLVTPPFDPEIRNLKRKLLYSGEAETFKKKHKADKTEQNDTEPKKLIKDKNQKEQVPDNSAVEPEKKGKSKKDKKRIQQSAEEVVEEPIKKQKKKKKDEKPVSEESDAIETDVYDDHDNILNPQEVGLIDLTDCETVDDYKKRKLSIAKAILAKERRLQKIDTKIVYIEAKGLTVKNKRFHTAMKAEKSVVEKRKEKLREALDLADKKIQEIKMEKENAKQIKTMKKNQERDRKSSESKSDSAEPTIDKKESKKRKREIEKEKKKELKKEQIVQRKSEKHAEQVKAKEGNSVMLNTDVIKVVDSLEPVLDLPSAKDFWTASALNANRNVQQEESSSSEDEDTDQPKKKRKKLSVAEKLAKARAEEEHVRELEKRAIESEHQPRSCEQFERALLANPDCSELWIAYMAFHLQATEIEKARAVGRKALRTISFREEQEKLNVWLALLNVEARFGTKETQQKTLEDALHTNEPFSIHSKLLEIYLETGSHQELASLVDLMMRRYRSNPEAYLRCGTACFKAGLCDKGRQVMQKVIAVLDKKTHVSILVQFALLERTHGSFERAEAIFEQITSVYPQRVDVCTAYVDMLLKSKDVDRVRQVLERMTSQKLPARKMKILYKKWIEVEEKFGDKQNVENIRERALEYIKKAKF